MTDCSEHRVVAREYGGGFELVNKKGNVLLVTQNVSVKTLVDLVRKDKEGFDLASKGKEGV